MVHAAGGFRDAERLVERLGDIDDYRIVVLDRFQVFADFMDRWSRSSALVPALPTAGVALVVGGRERPVAGWFAVPGLAGPGSARCPLQRAGAALLELAAPAGGRVRAG